MSFSSNVKAELCKDSMGRKSCAVAESYGVLLVLQHVHKRRDPHHHRKS